MKYLAVYAGQMFALNAGDVNIGPGILDTSTGRFHRRPEYTDLDVADTCRWLNGNPNVVNAAYRFRSG